MKKYDDASWHTEGQYPEGLPESAAATHVGMLLAWCVLNGYASEEIELDEVSELMKKSPALTPGAFCLRLDGKFTEEDVREEIHDFLEDYTDAEVGAYYEEYEIALAEDLDSFYHVPDTWETYEVVAKFISRAHREFEEDMA